MQKHDSQHRARNRGIHARTGALLAYVYELIDDGPELEGHELVLLILERVSALVGADAAVLWVVDEDGHMEAERFVGTRPTATAIRAERMLVELVTHEQTGAMINTGEAPLSPGLAALCDKLTRNAPVWFASGFNTGRSCSASCLHRVGRGAFANAQATDAARFARFAAVAVHR